MATDSSITPVSTSQLVLPACPQQGAASLNSHQSTSGPDTARSVWATSRLQPSPSAPAKSNHRPPVYQHLCLYLPPLACFTARPGAPPPSPSHEATREWRQRREAVFSDSRTLARTRRAQAPIARQLGKACIVGSMVPFGARSAPRYAGTVRQPPGE